MTCWAILASGPSMTAAQAEMVRGRCRVIAVNDTWQLAPWADALYACDGTWWDRYQGVPDFTGEKWTQDRKAAARWGLNHIAGVKADGLSLCPAVIHNGANSGYQALNLAVLWKAKRILLLGFDMRPVDGRRHWFGDHPKGMSNPEPETFARWIANFETTLPDLSRAGVEVVNCTPGSALTCFPVMSLEEALAAR